MTTLPQLHLSSRIFFCPLQRMLSQILQIGIIRPTTHLTLSLGVIQQLLFGQPEIAQIYRGQVVLEFSTRWGMASDAFEVGGGSSAWPNSFSGLFGPFAAGAVRPNHSSRSVFHFG
jgi:hypothetical protein